MMMIFLNVRELSTNDEMTVNSITTTTYHRTIRVGSDVFNYVASTAKWAAETDSGHCNQLQ